MSPPPLDPKLGLTNLIVNSLFSLNPNLEEHSADQLGNARKEYHGKSFEGRPCSRLPSCSAFLKEVVPSSVHLLVEYLEALHRAVVGVFGQILGPGFENDTSTVEEQFMGSMRTHNLRMTPRVYLLTNHVPEYVRRTGVQLGRTSEQALASQHRCFHIFYHKCKVNCTNSPVSRERLLNAVLHNNPCHL